MGPNTYCDTHDQSLGVCPCRGIDRSIDRSSHAFTNCGQPQARHWHGWSRVVFLAYFFARVPAAFACCCLYSYKKFQVYSPLPIPPGPEHACTRRPFMVLPPIPSSIPASAAAAFCFCVTHRGEVRVCVCRVVSAGLSFFVLEGGQRLLHLLAHALAAHQRHALLLMDK